MIIVLAILALATNYDDIIPNNSDIETLVFVRDGCSGCEAIKPIVKELQNEDFNILIITNLEEHKRFSVSLVPTTIVIVNGKEARRHVGALSKKEMVAFIEG